MGAPLFELTASMGIALASSLGRLIPSSISGLAVIVTSAKELDVLFTINEPRFWWVIGVPGLKFVTRATSLRFLYETVNRWQFCHDKVR